MKAKAGLEEYGTIGALLAAAACPICFPKLALIGALLGLGVLAPLEGYFVLGAQAMLVLALAGNWISYRRHGERRIVLLAGISVVAVLGALWIRYQEWLVYAGLAGIVVATIWSAVALRRCKTCSTDATAAPAATPMGMAGPPAP